MIFRMAYNTLNNFFFYCRMARKYSRRLRKRTGRRRMRGGAEQAVFPAPVENASYESSLSSPSKMMLAQGNEYASLHAGQHGGAAAINLAPAPPGFTGILDNSLRPQAWVGPLDASIQAIQGMSDVQGGGRRKGSRRKGSRRKGSRRGKKGSRRGKRRGSRRQRGGAAMTPFSTAADSGAPGMLLSPGMEQKAMMGMHTQEWKLAEDPNSFAPRM